MFDHYKIESFPFVEHLGSVVHLLQGRWKLPLS